SPLREWVVWLLTNVPGLPPIAQGIHILAVATILASAIMVCLRVIGIAVPTQQPAEMVARLKPWWYSALAVLTLTGGLFVIARPARYLSNPVAGIKFAALLIALVLTAWVFGSVRRSGAESAPLMLRAVACAGVGAWLMVMLAGRWIAYADYLFY
ncbi:MAG: hypothetical protein O3A63_16970, partial [Proteobacteria bacterium]|nr:hypothetical protein [Pseudomonadota bacterium]